MNLLLLIKYIYVLVYLESQEGQTHAPPEILEGSSVGPIRSFPLQL